LRALEAKIERRQAELRAAEHEGCALQIVARVGADRVDVAPDPLDGIVEKDSAAAAGLEQAIDGAHGAIASLRGIPPIARPLGVSSFPSTASCIASVKFPSRRSRAAVTSAVASAIGSCANGSSATRLLSRGQMRTVVCSRNAASAPIATPMAGELMHAGKTRPKGRR
jgi:hypothetical protein